MIFFVSACSTHKKKVNTDRPVDVSNPQVTKNSPPSEVDIKNATVEPILNLEEKKQETEEVKPEVIEKKKPVFGLILGPGSIQAFAHIGFVKELGKSRIPIKAIFGYEIGALVGSLYAKSSEPFEAEWQFSKINDEDWVPKKIFFTLGQNKPQDVEKFNLFLQNNFANLNFEDFKIKFGCSTLQLKSNNIFRLYTGKAVNNLKQCLALPPLLNNEQAFFAGVGQLDNVIQQMRAEGINHIIFVNPISLDSNDLSLHWNTIYQYFQSYRSSVETFVDLPTRGTTLIGSIEKKNELIRAGGQSAKKIIDQLRDLYQF